MAATTKKNPNDEKLLGNLLLIQLCDIDGLPSWFVGRCRKIGVKTAADLYRVTYLNGPQPGFGTKFYILANKVLDHQLGLWDRIGPSDPIVAIARDSESRMRKMIEEGMPQRLAEHEAVLLAGFDRKLAAQDRNHSSIIDQIVTNFRTRERVLVHKLKRGTREEFSFTAPDVSPESAARWLAQYTAGLVQDGFKFKANLECIALRSQMSFARKTEIQLSAKNVARLLVVFADRMEELVISPGRFAPAGSKVGQDCEGIEVTVESMFVGRSGGQLAMLEGVVIVAGMSDGEIKDLFKSTEPEPEE